MTTPEKNEVLVSFGSNFGNRTRNVADAICWFKNIADSVSSSHIYETPEIHGFGTPYMNAVAKGNIAMDLHQLVSKCKLYELEHGRTPESRKRGEVAIDIDIVVWDGSIVRPADFSRDFFQIGFRTLPLSNKDKFLLQDI